MAQALVIGGISFEGEARLSAALVERMEARANGGRPSSSGFHKQVRCFAIAAVHPPSSAARNAGVCDGRSSLQVAGGAAAPLRAHRSAVGSGLRASGRGSWRCAPGWLPLACGLAVDRRERSEGGGGNSRGNSVESGGVQRCGVLEGVSDACPRFRDVKPRARDPNSEPEMLTKLLTLNVNATTLNAECQLQNCER